MHSADCIFVAGHRGLAGSALVRRLRAGGFDNLLLRTHAELDLLDRDTVERFFDEERPRHVFIAAAKVGGILANDTCPADFLFQNLRIQDNVIEAAWRSGVERLLFLGSSCIYPRDCPQPIREEYLLTGPLEETNRAYAIAKIAGIEMCRSLNRQHGTRFIAAMPNNLYGPGDNYDLQTSHVLPALIRKAHEAKRSRAERLVLWGTGTPRREFLASDDMADACVFLMSLPDERFDALLSPGLPLVNIGSGDEVTILELAQLIAKVVGFRGAIELDRSKPDGTPRKLLDASRLAGLGWRARIRLEEGIGLAYRHFLVHHADGAGSVVR